MKRTIALLVSLGLVASACTSNTAIGGGTNDVIALGAVSRATPGVEQAATAADAINRFGVALYRRVVSGGAGPNTVFSPTSIALALAMTRPGARGTTATELDAVLNGLGGAAGLDPLNALDRALASRSGTFQTERGSEQVALRVANAPFGQRGTVFEAAYLDALASAFGAGLRLVDYKGDTEGARGTINSWVSDQTEKRIPELLGPNVLDTATRLTLVNAIYLKAGWLHPFAAREYTDERAFTRVDGSTVQVPMMRGGGHLEYASGGGWQAVELPYVGGQLAMTLIVPDSLATFESSLDASTLALITGNLRERLVNLQAPRFSIETKTDLAATLKAMGLTSAFSSDTADFSGITRQEPLYISAVIHQANIDVDENGTEAAAATAVVMAAGAAAPTEPEDPISLTIDRPFLYAIRDVQTGAVLFMGRVADPSVGK